VRHIESEEQVKLFRHASYYKYLDGKLRDYLFAVPNALPYSGKQAMLQMMQLKREGLTKGIPDIECFVAHGGYTGLHIELKKPKGVPSDVTKEQHEKMALLTKCGRKCVIAFGYEQAWKMLLNYLDRCDA